MSSYVSIKTKSGAYKMYNVPDEVYVYIRQLEHKVISLSAGTYGAGRNEIDKHDNDITLCTCPCGSTG